MAQKFGNGRWVREGFLDNRVDGTIVGRIVFAVVGPVDLYLRGNFKADIAGQVIQFRNPRFEDEDIAGQVIGDMENPQTGDVNLISFDPIQTLRLIPISNGSRRERTIIELNWNRERLGSFLYRRWERSIG